MRSWARAAGKPRQVPVTAERDPNLAGTVETWRRCVPPASETRSGSEIWLPRCDPSVEARHAWR